MKPSLTLFAALTLLATPSQAQDTFADRADTLLDYLNSNTPNVGQTGGGPNRIGRTGFWYGQGRIARGNTATGLSYISAAVGDADAESANGGFSLWPGMDAWYRHNGIFSQELKDKYRDEYVGARYYFGSTPNQRLMGATACYLASEIWGVGPVTSVSNGSNGTGDPSGKAFLDKILSDLPRYNSEEHNASQYLTFNLGPFHTLANFAPDPLLRQKARMGFDWMVADTAPSWLNGYACISNSRGRVAPPQNAYNGTTSLGWWLKFGGPAPTNGLNLNLHAQYALPDFPGLPEEIIAAATDRSTPYTRYSVAQRYVSGTKNAYFKQTWMTPKYAMWSQVEAEVSLNPDGSLRVNTFDTRFIQDGYQGERWGIAWDDAPSGNSVITIKSPTTYRGTTSGISIYEDTLQSEDTLIAVHNIPAPSGQTGNDGTYPNQYVKGALPNGYLAYTNESSSTGRIFLHYNNILVSIYLTNTFNNFTGSPGFDVPATKLGVIVETASPSEFPQSTAAARLAAFRSEILATTTDKTGIDDPAPRLTYTNRKGKTLSLTYGQAGSINGDTIDYLQWPTLGNPWMHQPPTGNLTLIGPNRRLHYNFNDWTITTNNRPTALATSPVTTSGITPIDIDLTLRVTDTETQSNKLRYQVASTGNGNVELLPDGHTARFTPAAAFAGSSGFNFIATDVGIDPRLVFHYDFEQAGLAKDASGNTRPATISTLGTGSALANSSAPAALAAHSTQSLRLTNSSVGSAKISCQIYQANANLSNGSWTFATWFNRADYADEDFLLSIGTGDGFGGDGDELQLYCEAQKQTLRLLHYNASNVLDVDLTATGVLTNTWRHAAIRFDRTSQNTGNVTLFLDGQAVGTASNITWALKQDGPIFIGGPAKPTVLSRDFNGSIDDVALFRGTLTDSEIQDLATSPVVHAGGLSLTQSVFIDSPLPAPGGLTATPSSTAIQLAWNSVGENINYIIQRSTSASGPFTTIASGITTPSFTDASALRGTQYFYQVLASNGAGQSPPSPQASATIPANDPSLWNSGLMNAWQYGARIAFPGYTQAETLANFPVLVALDSTQVPGFSYAQLAFPNGADLRFTDDNGTELSYEIDTWNPSGTSHIWVKVPSLTPTTSILAFWGNPTATGATASAEPDTLSGLSLWLKADAITGLANGATVNTWNDSSANARNATREAGAPVFTTNALNGKPVVRFPTDGESWFSFPQMADIRTVFWVVKESSATSAIHFLLGDDDKFHFHRGTSGPIWSPTNSSANIRNGSTRLMGTSVDGTTTSLGTGYRIVSVVTTGGVEASRLSRDRTQVGRSWDGDVAEIIIYNRALTEIEEARVGNYLSEKYALSSSYPGVPPAYTTDGSTWSNGYLGVFHLRETSGQHLSSTAGNAPTRSVSATNQGTSTGIVGTSSSFNGTSNFVSLPDFGTSPQTTVEAWVRLGGTPASSGAGIVSSDAWASGIVHFKADSGRGVSAAANSNGSVTTATGTLAIGTWSHVAYTVAGPADHALALYQDGALVGTAKGHSNNVLTGLNIAREFSTRYLNATVDEVRISNVARSAAWLQATHATISAPSTFANPSFVSTYTANTPAMVATLPATAIGQTTATLNGSLLHTGGLTTSVTLHYGTTDGGTTPASWDHSLSLGSLPIGNFSTDLNTLTPTTTYHYRVFATNSNGSVWAPDSVSFTTRPGAPTGLSIAAIEGKVSLQWNALPGATHYTVKRATSSGGPYTTLLSNITGTGFLDATATPGSLWHYIVSATTSGVEGADSAPLSVQVLAAPASLTATPGNASVALAWPASSGASSYTIKRSTTPGGPYTLAGTATTTAYTDTPLTNNTPYHYVVTATATGFESPPSPEIFATPLASLTAPTGLAALPATSSAILTWNAVPNAQTYTLRRSTTPGGPYSNVATNLLSPTFTNTGLANGTPYYYVVAALTGSITSPDSAEASVTPATTPTTFTTASPGPWSTAVWTPANPIAAFATTIVLNNAESISSTQNLGSFLFNKLQLTGQAVTLSGDSFFLSGNNTSISSSNNVAHSIANPISIDSLTSFSVPSNTLSITGEISGTGTLLKTGAGTLSLGSPNTYSGNTLLDGGTLRYTTANPTLADLILGATAGSASVNALDLSSASATATGLIAQTNSATANTLTIAAGNSLTIAGNASVGTYNSATTSSTHLTATGAGTLNISDESGQFTVGSSNSGNGVTTTVNLSALQNFNLQYPSDGGVLTLGNGSSINTKAATLTLAANNLIELDAILIGNNQVSNATQTLRLGSGTNILRVASISIGTTTSTSGGGRGIGTLLFNTSTGTLNLRDPSGTAGSNIFIADNGGNGNGFGSFDVTGHHADIKLNSLRMGASSNATVRTDTFAFDQGTLDIVSLDVGLAQDTTFTRTSQINLGGGTVTLGNGDSENPGLISLARNATGVLHLTGGTISAYQNIIKSPGTGSATLTLNGATLDLLGNSIIDLTTLNLQSGTLQNVAQINGGATITKSGSGTLILDGTNTFTSPITITAGTLQIGNDGPTGTPGSGPIVNNGSLRIDRSGTLDLPNMISGSGSLTLDNPAAADTVILGGANSFSGNVTLTHGTLRLTRSDSLGTGPKILFMQGTDRRLQLSNSITLPGNLTINASSNSFDGGGIENLDGDNTIASPINFTFGNAPLNISSISGSLTVSGNITPTATGRLLFLGGTSESENTISGQISDGSTTNLPLTKQGSGTWILANTHTYTGPTTINAGKLILRDASLASPISVTTGTLAPQGTPATSGSLSINSTGRLQASPTDTLTVGDSITLAGNLDLIAPPGLTPGNSYTILHKTSTGPVSGTFAGLPEGSSFNSSGYDWQITYFGGDGNDVVVSIATPPPTLTAIESWRLLHFGITENTGNAADNADPNHDGESNLLEFATGQDPHAATRATTLLAETPEGLTFTYTRSKAAFDAGYLFNVEYSDTLAPDSWTSAGPGTVITDGPLQTVRATIPESPDGRRFTRLRVSTP